MTICEQLIDSFNIVHTAGRVYNDLKPENVMISFSKNDEGEVSEHVTLIDFGLATKYKNENKSHIKDTEHTDMFKGNIHFSSLDQMNFYKTSRKDDIISLFLMMVWLLNGNQFVGKPEDIADI